MLVGFEDFVRLVSQERSVAAEERDLVPDSLCPSLFFPNLYRTFSMISNT